MRHYHSTPPYDEVTRADLDRDARQYAQDTKRLADRRGQLGGEKGNPAADLTPEEHEAEARRLYGIAARRRELAEQAAARGWASADTFRHDADHFDRLATFHDHAARQDAAA
ncbi:hypothetical protein JN535_08495 [Cellulosimicrobium cellulans]|uniref:hypothetical protein n=1 Tax=Cellulosimicrobium cellulans TaxID=1710 RepID=UPI00196321D7|nr:hypothetical protein [Cellulosimicrobium cellulans]MBN0040204.1 hypothetical protein [Cellulosimicrobium cellulans]